MAIIVPDALIDALIRCGGNINRLDPLDHSNIPPKAEKSVDRVHVDGTIEAYGNHGSADCPSGDGL